MSDDTMNPADDTAEVPAAPRRYLTPEDALLLDGIYQLVGACHSQSREAGWWDNDIHDDKGTLYTGDRHGMLVISTKLALVHSEVSEALEGARKGLMDDHLPHRPMLEVELADAVIRIADLAGALNLDLAGAVLEKLAYNRTRADHTREARAAEGGKRV